jgi:hypothetical protein
LKEIAEGKIDMNKEIVLIGTGKSQLGPLKQQSVVLAHAVKTEMEITKTREALNNKDLSNPERIKLLQDLITYEDDMLNNNLAVRKTGETWGNWGRMRQLYATMDYSLRAMIAKARVFTGGKEVKQKYIDKFTECADKLDKLANDLYEAEKKLREEREINKVKEAERRLKTQEDFIQETKKNLNKIKIKNENSIIEKIKKESEGELHDGLSSLLQKLARIKVAKGKENFNDVLDAVAEDIKEFIPDVDKEKLADLISDYRFDELTRKEIKEQIRALKIMLSKHKEMKGKPMTKEQKDMQRVIKERARKLGVKPGVTDEQIKEQWEAKANDYLKKLEDSIADIQKELDARIKKAKGKEYDDPITNELKERLKNKIEERDALLNKDNLTEEQKIDRVIENINKTISDIEKAIRLINEDKKNPNVEFIEKGDKRIEVSNTTVDNLREEKERLTAERDALSPKETKEQAEYNAYVKGLNRRLKYYKNKLEQLKSGTYAPRKTKKIPQLAQNDEQVKKIQMEIMKTRDESDMIVEKIRLQNRKTTEKILDGFLQWWNLTKALVASWDVSAPGRQGVFFITKVPIFMKSFAKMFSFAFSKKQFDNYMYAAKSDPEYEIMTKKYKLGLTFPTTKMTAQEELFSTHLINVVKNIPVYGWGISASERAFVGFLNKLRMDLYYNYKSQLEKIPMTQEQFDKEMESFVHLINIGTGRSHLGKRDNAIQILNSVLFAPRFALSRFEIAGMLLSPRTWSSKTPEYRKEALKQWFSYMGTVSLTLFLLKQAFGDDIEIEIDPRSSDFGRIVYKGVRYDLWGGILQPYRLVTQVGLGERKNVMTGEITDLRNKRKYPFALPTNVLFQYWGNKIHPSLNVLFTFINNYNQFTGEEFDVTKEWMELVVPILIQELVKIAEEEGIEEIPLPATLSMFGIGVNYYKPKKKGKGKTQPRP